MFIKYKIQYWIDKRQRERKEKGELIDSPCNNCKYVKIVHLYRGGRAIRCKISREKVELDEHNRCKYFKKDRILERMKSNENDIQ